MPRVAPRVPELSEILCSACGYVLNGLPETASCPECGQQIVQGLDADRIAPAWESAESGKKTAGFFRTTILIITRPKHFYRTFTVRGPLKPAREFARIHWAIAGVLFGLAVTTHQVWFYYHISRPIEFPGGKWAMFAALLLGLTLLSYFGLDVATRFAAKLTTWEATYRGYRLPYPIVLRGLYYHAAHYLPVAIAAALVVEGYQLLLLIEGAALPINSPIDYLYVLAGLVILSAIYLFQTYWIGMRNMMYVNR